MLSYNFLKIQLHLCVLLPPASKHMQSCRKQWGNCKKNTDPYWKYYNIKGEKRTGIKIENTSTVSESPKPDEDFNKISINYKVIGLRNSYHEYLNKAGKNWSCYYEKGTYDNAQRLFRAWKHNKGIKMSLKAIKSIIYSEQRLSYNKNTSVMEYRVTTKVYKDNAKKKLIYSYNNSLVSTYN